MLDIGNNLLSLDGSFGDSTGDNIEGLLIVDSMGSTDNKIFISEEGIQLGSTDGNVIGTLLGNVDRITLGIDVGTNLNSLDRSFDGSNNGKLEVLLMGYSLVSTDGEVLCSG